MFQRILVLAMANISAVIYFSLRLLAGDYFQTGLAWCSEDQLVEIRNKIKTKLDERCQQNTQQLFNKSKNTQKMIFSIDAFSRGYGQYFDYSTLCESKENVESIDASLQKIYDDFLNAVFDGFLSIPQNWHTYYNACVISICEENVDLSSYKKMKSLCDCFNQIKNEQRNDQILACLDKIEFKANHKEFIKTIDGLSVVSKDDRDSVFWHATQTTINYKDCPDLCDFHYLIKRISEIPSEHRSVILRDGEPYTAHTNTQKWLRIIRQANVAEYYVKQMYKFIPFLDEQSFWSISVHYSYNWFPRYSRAQYVHTMPTEEHLNVAFELFHERITHAYFLPRSQEATDALRWYLSPLFPVFWVYKIRSCKALEPCW